MVLIETYATGGVGINSTALTSADTSASLDLSDPNKGFLTNRLTLTSTTDGVTIPLPALGLFIFNTGGALPKAFWYNSNTAASPIWKRLLDNTSGWTLNGNTAITNPANPAIYGTTAITATENWLGTTDARDIVFGTNGIECMRLYNTTGVLSIGAPQTFGRTTVTGNSSAGLTLWAYSGASNTSNDLYFRRSSGAIGANATVTTTGTVLGQLVFQGAGTGATYENGARIRVETSAASGATDMPTQILVSTSPDGSATLRDRMRIGSASNNTSEVWINLASPYAGDVFSATSDQNGDYGVNGYNTLTTATTGGGVYGETRSAGTIGVWGFNNNASGTGGLFVGQNVTGSTLVAGQGVAGTGNTTGGYFRNTSLGISQAIYSDNGGTICRVNYWNGATQYKILGTGTVSTIVTDTKGKKVVLHAPETPEIYFQDYGAGKLVNGKAHIQLDPILTKNIVVNEKHALQVFIQLNGDCKGVFVTNRTATGFDVTELQGGTSNIEFTWSITANRADEVFPDGRISKNADVRFEEAPADEEVREIPAKVTTKSTSLSRKEQRKIKKEKRSN